MKKVLVPVLAAIIAIGGYFYGTNNAGNNSAALHNVDEVPAQIMQINKEGLAPNHYINALVVKASDGDTVEVSYKGEFYKVRFLDVDTPESVKQGVPVQTYSKEASELTKGKLVNQPVKLVFEKSIRDKYGRLLAYVFMKDGTFYNALLVRNGFARVEIVKPNAVYAGYFYRLQEQAIQDKAGLWSLPEKKQPFVKDESGDYVPRYYQKEKKAQ